MIDDKLTELIDVQSQMKSLKQREGNLKSWIKDYCNQNGCTSYAGTTGTFTYQKIEQFDLDTEKAIDVLKANLSAEDFEAVTEVKYVINEKALEHLADMGKFDMTLLADCVIYKDAVYRLTAKQKKGDK